MYVTSRTDAWMFLEKLRLYAIGDELVNKGFFKSDAEEAESRHHAYEHTTERLNALWDNALADATQARVIYIYIYIYIYLYFIKTYLFMYICIYIYTY